MDDCGHLVPAPFGSCRDEAVRVETRPQQERKAHDEAESSPEGVGEEVEDVPHVFDRIDAVRHLRPMSHSRRFESRTLYTLRARENRARLAS